MLNFFFLLHVMIHSIFTSPSTPLLLSVLYRHRHLLLTISGQSHAFTVEVLFASALHHMLGERLVQKETKTCSDFVAHLLPSVLLVR